MTLANIRRVITGVDDQGRSRVSRNAELSNVFELEAVPGTWFHEVWETGQSPALIDNREEEGPIGTQLAPPRSGTRIRFVDIPPDKDSLGTGAAKASFAQLGDAAFGTSDEASPHPLMHKTETVDYGVVISGAITLVLDTEETELKAGDVVIQRGTNHAWSNRSSEPCRMLFVLIDGTFEPS